MPRLYTVGHSLHSIEQFNKLLNSQAINCVIDVRSTPYSKYSPQFNTNELRKFLSINHKSYIFMGEEFGARRSESSLYDIDGLLDFEKVIRSALFQAGVKRVKSGLNKGYKIAFMCTEKDPLDCHRSILVGRAFQDEAFEVLNIHEDGSVENQKSLEERLLDLYFPDRNQTSIFDILEGGKSKDELVVEAYRLRNKEIGYKIGNEAGII
ncbi:protein of unknown function DUF1130 [Desulfitobacterium hafniense DCB-2]|uniref:Protein containing DUF1130 n=2 Tax=Desulfitobacterium hafniense TaxID=49338 RepID=A0A098AVS5_DESHA|nr:DUF488 domain-containing protein [Desulfitobacterium hafniense]ACL18719.1 protein of unknown function DUF1130 [Desulfitobacterium hafniense DCB-2]CDX00689.1 Protein containing DUF1130 [Desulfitobacterium hafniense]